MVRWWSRGFALLGLAVCAILPLGAIGTIDASFDSSVLVPHSRAAGGRAHGRARAARVHVRSTSPAEVGDHLPSVAPRVHLAALTGPGPVPAALVLVLVLVVLALLPPGHDASVGLPRRRGPPSYC